MVLSQHNPDEEIQKTSPGRWSDLRGWGAIEQDADLVALLYKADPADPKKPAGGDDDDEPEQEAVPVNLLIAKQRNGPTGDVHLTFLKAYTRFESAAKVSAEDVPMDS